MGDRRILLQYRPVEFFRLRCKYRGACCQMRSARHHSAAVQPRNPVAAPRVDWFYAASFSRSSPQWANPLVIRRFSGSRSLLRSRLHLQYAPGSGRLSSALGMPFSPRAWPGIRARKAPGWRRVAGSVRHPDRRSRRRGSRGFRIPPPGNGPHRFDRCPPPWIRRASRE